MGGISKVIDIVHDRVCVIRVQLDNGSVLNIMSVYLPAQGSEDSFAECIDDLTEIVESRENNSISIICGDCNGDLRAVRGSGAGDRPNRQGATFKQFLVKHNLFPANLETLTSGPDYTYEGFNGKSFIDYIVIPEAIRGSLFSSQVGDLHPLNNSDHLPVFVTLCVGKITLTPPEYNGSSRIKWEKLNSHDRKVRYSDILARRVVTIIIGLNNNRITEDLIELGFKSLTEAIHESARGLPRTKFKSHVKPYWTAELTELKRLKVITYREWVDAARPRADGDLVYTEYKRAKKIFASALRTIAKNMKIRK